jgi:phosphatidylglycerol lysyltransferase
MLQGRRANEVMSQRLRAWLHALLAAVLFAAALAILHHELRDVHYRDLLQAVASLPRVRLFWAIVLCIASYAVLTGYDQLAFVYVKKAIGRWRIAVASFVGVAIANNAGLALLSGASVRYRFYTRWGIGAGDLSRVVLFCSTAYWLGLLALGGWSLTFHPHPAIERYGIAALGRGAGIALLAVTVAYLAAAAIHLPPLRIRSLEIAIPSFRLALAQLALSMLDWVLATAVLYALLPSGGPSFGLLLGAFLAAQLIGMVSQVPGGVGIFEGVMLIELAQFYRTEQILSALLLYRVIYYLLPLCAGLAILIGDEVRVHRHRLVRFGAIFGNATLLIAPKVLAVFTFLAGVVLLFSGATPAYPGRLAALARFLPLGVFEASHFLGSVVGVALLVVAQGVARRLDVAYYAAILLLALGIGFSLLKAGDWEEGVLLLLLLLAFLPCRGEFERRASFFEVGLSPGWTLAALVAVGASIWLGFFAFRHLEYRDELWWRFALDHDAPRFLRASVGATVTLFAIGVARLMQPVAPRLPAPTSLELDGVEVAIEAQGETYPYLVFLGDKSVLWNENRSAFLMYGAQGRSWVALGDPVGPPEVAPDLIRSFLERVDDYGGVPVFYQVRGDRLHSYADFGLTVVKLGEEARVRLDTFSIEGGAHHGLRTALHRLEREGAEFRVVPAADVPAILPELRAVSDEWLEHKAASEKGFSLGFFDEAYLRRFPVATIEVAGRIQAFANVWPGPKREELSVDLMRFRRTAPKGAMEGLFGQLMLWGKREGYQWFSLGVAPLSGLPSGALAPAWSRFGSLVFRHGEAFYNFQGVRAYKDKFHPVWEPRYLAYAGVLQLPRVLADITALVAGGVRGVFR